MPESTALKGTNSDRVRFAMIRASVVLPQPGGPQSSREPSSSRSICVRRGFPGASKSSWPRNSSSVRGRILSAKGNQDEAARELSISQSLLDRSRKQQEQRITGLEVDVDQLMKTRIASAQDTAAFQEFLQHLTPLIAGSYNNLGVHAAMAGQFDIAAKQFARAAQWNPSLPGVDRNWARAAFAAHDCSQAIMPLRRAAQHDPSEPELNSMLAACGNTTNP